MYNQDQEKLHPVEGRISLPQEQYEKHGWFIWGGPNGYRDQGQVHPIHETYLHHSYEISDKAFFKENNKNLQRLVDTQYQVSRNILIYNIDKVTMESENDWEPVPRKRKEKLQRFQDSLVYNQLTKNKFAHAWKQIYEHINNFCTYYVSHINSAVNST